MKNDTKMAILIPAILLISVSGLVASATAAEKYHWEQVSEEGFSDLTNDYVWSMASYTVNRTEYLYAGTLNTNFSSALDDWTNWSNVTDGCEVWRTNGTAGPDGKYLWEQVVGPFGTQDIIIPLPLLPPLTVDATAGFRSYCIGTRGMIVFADLLWVGTSNPITGTQIWVTNGTHWKRANVPGFGSNETSSSRGMAVFNNHLYVGTANEVDGGGVFRYNGSTDFTEIGNLANVGQWEQVNEPGFGEPDINLAVGELITYSASEEYLYAGTWNVTGPDLIGGLMQQDFSFLSGCQVWRTNGTVNASDPPRLLWEKVVDGGFSSEGGSPLNGAILSSAIFNGQLYMGTQNFGTGAEIWRTANGTDWEPVANLGFFNFTPPDFDFRGFGNGYMWCMINFSDQLFVGTMNPFFGAQVWMSDTGNAGTFEQVNANGMNEERKIPIMELVLNNDTYPIMGIDQYGVRTFAAFNGSLHLGTASFGDWIDKLINEALKDESYNLSDYLGNWTANFSDYVGGEVWRITETTYIPPTVEVTKTVWDPAAEEWIDADCFPLLANVGDTVRFNVSIHANGTYNLTNLTIIDFLSSSLEYTDTATLRYPNGTVVSREPEPVIRPPIEGGCCCFATSWTILVWNLKDVVLEPCQTMTLEYNATVARCGVETAGLLGSRGIDLNFLFAKGQNAETQEYGYGWDYALVSAPCPAGDATDELGDVVEVYTTGETVYATGSGFRPNSTVDVYIVSDRAWADGDTVSDYFIFKVEKNVPTDEYGNVVPTEIWPNPNAGEYDMFFDANQNGIFEVGVDAVDHPNHPGFIVQGLGEAAQVPVLTPLGLLALMGLLSIIATRTLIRKKR